MSKSKLENVKSTKINVEKWKEDFYLGKNIFLFYDVRNKLFEKFISIILFFL